MLESLQLSSRSRDLKGRPVKWPAASGTNGRLAVRPATAADIPSRKLPCAIGQLRECLEFAQERKEPSDREGSSYPVGNDYIEYEMYSAGATGVGHSRV